MKRQFKNVRDFNYYLIKIIKNVVISKNECWNWISAKNKAGYGATCYNGKLISVHQLSMIVHGKYESGKYVDHICKNRSCCNPDHLRMVTVTENTARYSLSPSAINFKKTHCIRGHEFSTSGYVTQNKRGNNVRVSRDCGRAKYELKKLHSNSLP